MPRIAPSPPLPAPPELAGGAAGRASGGASVEAERQQVALLHAGLQQSPDGFVCVNAAGVVTFLNDAARAIFGRAFCGSHIEECAEKYEVLLPDGTPCPPEELPLARAALRRETVLDAACVVRRPDGSLVDVVASALPLWGPGGQNLGAVLTLRDVTSRRALERAVERSEARFKALATATAQMIWTTDAAGRVTEDSPSWRRFTGQSFEAYEGRGWLDAIHPEDRARSGAAWDEAVLAKATYEVEYRVRRHDGAYRWMVARGTPVLDERGEVREWVGCNWDVHPIKAAEDFYQTLLAVVGHDLRNPLNSVQLAAAALQEGAAGGPERALVARVGRGVQRAASVLDLLTDLTEARLRGGFRLTKTEVDLGELADEIVAEFEGQSAGRPIEIVRRGDARGHWDRARLGQIVSNLVANALHHGTPGTPVRVGVEGPGDSVRIEVENQAPPIPPGLLPSLFDPFKRAHREGERGHLGLGLYIVKQLVDAHGGSISVESTTERTRFAVELPRSTGG